jgi:hypothetical protein
MTLPSRRVSITRGVLFLSVRLDRHRTRNMPLTVPRCPGSRHMQSALQCVSPEAIQCRRIASIVSSLSGWVSLSEHKTIECLGHPPKSTVSHLLLWNTTRLQCPARWPCACQSPISKLVISSQSHNFSPDPRDFRKNPLSRHKASNHSTMGSPPHVVVCATAG